MSMPEQSTSKSDLSIQIVNYNTVGYLERCLEGIVKDLKDTFFNWRVLILDNSSRDDLTPLERRYESSGQQFEFHYSPWNLGFGGGHNYLADKSESDAILVLSPDIEFTQPNTLERLLGRITKETSVVGPKLRDALGRSQVWDHGETLYGNPGLVYWRERSKPLNVGWVSGACLMIQRETFERLHGFDTGFFMYKEDDDLCYRVIKDGGKVLYDPTIELKHHGSAVGSKADHMSASMRYFMDKHRKNIGPLAYWGNRAWIQFVNKY